MEVTITSFHSLSSGKNVFAKYNFHCRMNSLFTFSKSTPGVWGETSWYCSTGSFPAYVSFQIHETYARWCGVDMNLRRFYLNSHHLAIGVHKHIGTGRMKTLPWLHYVHSTKWITLTTNVSLTGWQRMMTQNHLDFSAFQTLLNVLELRAAAFQTLTNSIYQEKLSSTTLMRKMTQIMNWAQSNLSPFSLVFVPGLANTLANTFSYALDNEWFLLPQIFDMVVQK